ncbi:MAG: acyltransferase [Pseudobutyrivibrio sp.]|nr:acyltransferase [Pseudobutyrivibrio sp.]
MSKSNSKINSLQALRALAFIGIFLVHSKIAWGWPRLGVSIFFGLSGFLMTYTYWDRTTPTDIKGAAIFSLSKIKKMYPLHIITMLCAVLIELKLYRFFGTLRENLFLLVRNIILNTFLIQSWYPDSSVNVALNGVAWYLCVAMFLYFLFPFILRWMKNQKLATLILVAVTLIALQIIAAYPMAAKYGEANNTYRWFMYTFPVYRIADFYAGCVLGRIYMLTDKDHQKSEQTTIAYTIIELTLLLFSMWFSLWLGRPTEDAALLSLRNWSSGYILMAMAWIWVFVQCKGLLTKAISNPLMIALGDISPQAFLIHYVVVRFVNAYMAMHMYYYDQQIVWILFVGELAVTIILCIIYNKISGFIKSKLSINK